MFYIEKTSSRSFISVDFTSKGAVLDTQSFNVTQLDSTSQLYDINTLYKGGVLIVLSTKDGNAHGYAYSNDGIYNRTWGLPNNYTYTNKIYGVTPENTVWAIADASSNSIATNQWTSVYSNSLKTFSTGNVYMFLKIKKKKFN